MATIFWKLIVPKAHLIILTLRHGWVAAKTRRHYSDQLVQKHLSRLITSLTDFQKAQCFFMLATNVAAIVVVQRGGLDPQSLQQIYNAYIFLKLIAVSGYLPITFTLANLYIVGMLSWYLILLSSLTVILSVATLGTIGVFSPSESDLTNLAILANNDGPQACNGKRPGVYCLQLLDDQYRTKEPGARPSSIDNDAYSMLGFCLVVLLLLIGNRVRLQEWSPARKLRRATLGTFSLCMLALRHIGRHHLTLLFVSRYKTMTKAYQNRFLHWYEALNKDTFFSRLYRRFADSLHNLKTLRAWQFYAETCSRIWSDLKIEMKARGFKALAKSVLKYGICVLIIYLYLWFFTIFLYDLAWFAYNEVYSNTWNFGQVVAITVWAPPLCEFIHLELRESHPVSLHNTYQY